MYTPTATPPPLSFHAALATPVKEAAAREAFGVVRVVRSWDRDDTIMDLVVPRNDDGMQTIATWYEAFETNNNTTDHDSFRLEGPNVSRWYVVVVGALLAYRASHPGGDPLPGVWIVDAAMKPLPSLFSKAFVWRHHLRTSGQISAMGLMSMAYTLQIRYGGNGVGTPSSNPMMTVNNGIPPGVPMIMLNNGIPRGFHVMTANNGATSSSTPMTMVNNGVGSHPGVHANNGGASISTTMVKNGVTVNPNHTLRASSSLTPQPNPDQSLTHSTEDISGMTSDPTFSVADDATEIPTKMSGWKRLAKCATGFCANDNMISSPTHRQSL